MQIPQAADSRRTSNFWDPDDGLRETFHQRFTALWSLVVYNRRATLLQKHHLQDRCTCHPCPHEREQMFEGLRLTTCETTSNAPLSKIRSSVLQLVDFWTGACTTRTYALICSPQVVDLRDRDTKEWIVSGLHKLSRTYSAFRLLHSTQSESVQQPIQQKSQALRDKAQCSDIHKLAIHPTLISN